MWKKPDGNARGQASRKPTRFTYANGPMYYLAQQVVKHMHECGWPCEITFNTVLFPAFSQGDRGFDPLFEYTLITEVSHFARSGPISDRFREDIRACVQVVKEKFKIHFEMDFHERGNRTVKLTLTAVTDIQVTPKQESLHQRELDQIFAEQLTDVWKAHTKSKGYRPAS